MILDPLSHSIEASEPGNDGAPFQVRPFEPPMWLRGPHAQTLGGKAFRRAPRLQVQRVRLDTPDRDFIDVDVVSPPTADAPVVVVLHGLEGSSRRRYVLEALLHLQQAGLQGIAMNFRGCSGEPNRTPRAYHSGETGDLSFVLSWVRRTFPARPVGALGFSLGGNVLLKRLVEGAGEADISAACTISVPFDLSRGATQLEQGPMGRLYSLYFLRSLRRKMRAKEALLRDRIDLERGLSAPTIRLFDEYVTAPLHGFHGAEDYYTRSSSLPILSRIRRPTLLIQSMDDPFLPREVNRAVLEVANPQLHLAFSQRGGHVGFIGHRAGPGPRYHAEHHAAAFLARQLKQ